MPLNNWHLFDDVPGVAREAARRILTAADREITAKGRFSIVLAGGGTPESTYRLLVDADTDWSKWHIYFGDERCLPIDDVERNSVMAASAWLDHVTIPDENIHPIPAEQGAEAGASAYSLLIADAVPFDMVLLGMGEDGHTASLFPGQIHSDSELVHAVHDAPKPPPDRISLSRNALSDCMELLILVTGASKQQAVTRWKQGGNLPIANIGAHDAVDILLDKDAAGA
ncbi:MAG: 6-phosphogluconolactonase [Gammaproteobacteria bacterium]|nr:6-phosphogluconolactonase [Gammaproteobacteria bacterium]